MKRRIWCAAVSAGVALCAAPLDAAADRDIGTRSASAQVRFVIVIPPLLTVASDDRGRIVARSNDGPLVFSSSQRTLLAMRSSSTLAFERGDAGQRDLVIAAP